MMATKRQFARFGVISLFALIDSRLCVRLCCLTQLPWRTKMLCVLHVLCSRAWIPKTRLLRLHSSVILLISHNALGQITYAIFPPFCQVIQPCAQECKGHIDDLLDLNLTRDLAQGVCHVSSLFLLIRTFIKGKRWINHLLCLIISSQWQCDIFCSRILCMCFFRKARHLSCL